MANLNKVLLMGRLTRDPELRYTPQGIPVTEIGMAINREFSTQSGERRKETVFVDVKLWRRQAEVVCQWLKKGSPIFIEGRLVTDTWETQDGQRRSKMRVEADGFQFVGSRGDREGGEDPGRSPEAPRAAEGARVGEAPRVPLRGRTEGAELDYQPGQPSAPAGPGEGALADGGGSPGGELPVEESEIPF